MQALHPLKNIRTENFSAYDYLWAKEGLFLHLLVQILETLLSSVVQWGRAAFDFSFSFTYQGVL